MAAADVNLVKVWKEWSFYNNINNNYLGEGGENTNRNTSNNININTHTHTPGVNIIDFGLSFFF